MCCISPPTLGIAQPYPQDRTRMSGHPGGVRLRHPPQSQHGGGMLAVAACELRIRGRASDSLLASFDGLDADFEPAETVLRGTNLDQSALHGVLERVRALGLELVEIRQVKPGRQG